MFREIRNAWRLYRSDSRAETVAALALVFVVAAPVIRAYLEVKSESSRG
jgi:hypothetical protein